MCHDHDAKCWSKLNSALQEIGDVAGITHARRAAAHSRPDSLSRRVISASFSPRRRDMVKRHYRQSEWEEYNEI
jgi:hypothetical protein